MCWQPMPGIEKKYVVLTLMLIVSPSSSLIFKFSANLVQ